MGGIEVEYTIVENDINMAQGVAVAYGRMAKERVNFLSLPAGNQGEGDAVGLVHHGLLGLVLGCCGAGWQQEEEQQERQPQRGNMELEVVHHSFNSFWAAKVAKKNRITKSLPINLLFISLRFARVDW